MGKSTRVRGAVPQQSPSPGMPGEHHHLHVTRSIAEAHSGALPRLCHDREPMMVLPPLLFGVPCLAKEWQWKGIYVYGGRQVAVTFRVIATIGLNYTDIIVYFLPQ